MPNYTNYKINKSGVAGIQHFQAKEYSNTLGLRGGGSRYKFTMILKNKIKEKVLGYFFLSIANQNN